jgi:rhamnose utilization protein RhaD (predicted bifunctional aldolase and dehydrogenase)/NAD(P)-dependent dehydrogenase (short-subunit alcohol dehydrogenase family)
MRSLWNDTDAAAWSGDLGLRVYTSRLLGRDPTLVLHGGGNTSVKTEGRDGVGRPIELLYVKGSGRDLETITEAGFAPVRLDDLLALGELDVLSDVDMARQLRVATIDPHAPAPSVEAILHAILPFRYVDHTHPDALLSVMNTPTGSARVRELYGDDVVVIDYVMPGFALAKACADAAAALDGRASVKGMVLLGHGLFTFSDDARESYERMIELVGRAEDYLREHGAWDVSARPGDDPGEVRRELSTLRRAVSTAAGRPMIVRRSEDPRGAWFAQRDDLERLAGVGPATPDHVLRTKRLPLVGRDVAAYTSAYQAYFLEQRRNRADLQMLDPAPRVVLDSELGLLTIGASARDARIVEDIYLHTIEIVSRADALDRWSALPAGDLFDVEYWELEQAKLKRAGAEPPFSGEVVAITGAASGIGRASAEAFLAAGAAVVALDRDPAVVQLHEQPDFLGLVCDVTVATEVAAALEAAVRSFGGLDMLVLNAGVFPAGAPIAALDDEDWRRTMTVNADAALSLLREAHPLLRDAPRGGRVVINGSKNVAAPGPGAAAYSSSKAAITQLARVAALEWGADGIRVNVVHPNAVFDTGVWSAELIESRAASYGLSAEEYRTNNVLRTEITSADVARMIIAMCGDAFARTTGAQVAVDGGNDRVI